MWLVNPQHNQQGKRSQHQSEGAVFKVRPDLGPAERTKPCSQQGQARERPVVAKHAMEQLPVGLSRKHLYWNPEVSCFFHKLWLLNQTPPKYPLQK